MTGGGSGYPNRCGSRAYIHDDNTRTVVGWYSGRGMCGGSWDVSDPGNGWSLGGGSLSSVWKYHPLYIFSRAAAH